MPARVVGRMGSGVSVSIVTAVLLAAVACGQKQPEQPATTPGEQSAPFETSLTGYLSKNYDGDSGLCAEAARTALQRLGLKVASESGGIFKKSFAVEGDDGTSAQIDIASLTKDSTRVSVKVGYLFGDRFAAQRIHSEIEAEIGARRGAAKEMQKKWGGGLGGVAAGGTPSTAPGR